MKLSAGKLKNSISYLSNSLLYGFFRSQVEESLPKTYHRGVGDRQISRFHKWMFAFILQSIINNAAVDKFMILQTIMTKFAYIL